MSTSIARLPRVTESVAALPVIPESRAPLPRVRETQLPKGRIPYIPPAIEVESSSEETSLVELLVIPSLEVVGSHEETSAAEVLGIHTLKVESSSEETSEAEATDTRPIDVVSESEETSSVDVVAILEPVSTSEESGSVTEFGFDAVSSSEESSTAEVTLVGVLHPVSSSEETSSVDIRTFMPSQMVKSGASSTFSTSASQITGWTPDTDNYPGSSVSNNDLVVQADATGVILSASIRFTGSLGGRTITLRILLDNVQVATSGAVSVSSGAGTVVNASVSGMTVAEGSLVRVTAQASQAGMISAANDATSYVRISQP